MENTRVELAAYDEERRTLTDWLKNVGFRPLSFLIGYSYRSSRFWTAYLS